MEPHPVPQNILDVEFKLFGSFTLNQFVKMMIGALVALLIFFTNIHPLIKWPLITAAILIGIAMAVMQNFGVWLGGFLKAIFISPRYVWVKESRTPEVLTQKQQKAIEKDRTVSQAANSTKYDLSQISLERMFAARESANAADVDARDKNIERVINQVMPKKKERVMKKEDSNLITQHINNSVVKDKNYYINEINKLKQSLRELVQDQQYKEKEAEILHQINEIYQEMRHKYPNQQDSVNQVQQPANTERTSNFQGTVEGEGQIVFGIVVDKNNNPVTDASIFFDLKNSANDITVQTDSKGQFNSVQKIAPGKYAISVTHPTLKFHTYAIEVGSQKLPAYKLRGR